MWVCFTRFSSCTRKLGLERYFLSCSSQINLQADEDLLLNATVSTEMSLDRQPPLWRELTCSFHYG
ncbi:hypothetical protein E2I00_015107 [Balaenoptera physalus]|uniref:Uncharacterized protein n=1 Tax=Balaenoptera physalus TaxID=9770 RepID=A0A643CBS4_BALPH|nr:hypothetical protein E2I00_015107 [Balaenoptera physalus]